MGGRVKVLRSIPRRSLGGVFQASASRHSMRSPPHNGMSPRNPWTWGGDCSTERMGPLANVGWRGSKDHKGRRSIGDRMECFHLCVG